MMDAVSVNSLTKRFGDFTAVDGVTFSVPQGEIFGFLGPNGAGKSTTIKMLCGILAPTGGTGTVAGFDIVTEQADIKMRIGYMSQRFSLYDDLSVRENLSFYGSIYGLEGTKLAERIDWVFDLAGIGGRGDAMVRTLPAGVKQRLALGCAILHEPPILFLDEPTSGVDPIMRRNFWELIYQFSRAGKTIFVTTHYMDEAEHCDRMALIIAGKVMALDSPARLKEDLPYAVWSLKLDDFIAAFDRVAALPFVREAAIFGSAIHILSERDFPLERELGSVLKKIGVGKFEIERIPASLEDVFVTSARKYL